MARSGVEIVIGGGVAEGGGQALRAALSLSLATGRPFTYDGKGVGGAGPGLRPEHCDLVRAVASLCAAELHGVDAGSHALAFRPRAPVVPGDYLLDAGPAGSAPLLFQTVCWPLSLAGSSSRLVVRGATHRRSSPTFHDLALVWGPAVARLGFRFELALQAAAFHPESGGEMSAVVAPAHAMPPLDLRHRGTLQAVEVVATEAGLPFAVAEELAARALQRLRELGIAGDASRVPVPARGSSGSHVLLVATFERGRSGFGALGTRGQAPAQIADEAVEQLAEFLRSGGAVDPHLGDQLLLPAALAASGRIAAPPGVVPVVRYTVSRVTERLRASAALLARFLDLEVAVLGAAGEEGEVRLRPSAARADGEAIGGEW